QHVCGKRSGSRELHLCGRCVGQWPPDEFVVFPAQRRRAMNMTTARNALSSLVWEVHMRRAAILSLSVLTLFLSLPRPAAAVPAFARKYGVRCTVCHEAWPVLNDFGRAFRDNGYRMNLGKDEPAATEPAYWPVFAAAQPHFGFDLVKSHGAATETTLERNGQFQSGVSLLA